MVVFDSDFLSFLIHSNPGIVYDPKSKKPVERIKEKINLLITGLSSNRQKVLIPTTVLSEILTISIRSIPEITGELSSNSAFKIVPFDEKAAIELAIMTSNAIKAKDKKGGSKKGWHEIKFDRQLIAIAKTQNASHIYSNDRDIITFGKKAGIHVVSVWDLPDPPPVQTQIDYVQPDSETPDDEN